LLGVDAECAQESGARDHPPRAALVGWIVAAFFVAVFPGNIEWFVRVTDAFGLDSDLARGIRLLFQPLLVLWPLWATGAWKACRERGQSGRPSRS
jgi:uncharacterized membrane protein